MSLINQLVGAAQQAAGGGGGTPQAAVIHAVIRMLSNPQQGALGLTGLLETLRQGGLGSVVDSWVGRGDNQAVQPQQLSQALGADWMQQLSSDASLPEPQTAQVLAQVLPVLVNQLTPDGRVPAAGALDLGRLDVMGLVGQLVQGKS